PSLYRNKSRICKISRPLKTLVRKGGFEPPRLSAPPPQDGVSASSTTSAAGSIIAKGVSVLYDGREGFRVQAGAAYQGPVDFFLGHEGLHVLRFDRTAIQDAEIAGEVFAESLGGLASNQKMRGGGELRCGGLSGPDGPHRFVGHHQL